jgi:hypothetical protein
MYATRKTALVVLCAAVIACAQQKSPTPDDVSAHYHALLDSLHADWPGESTQRLEAFLNEYEKYAIADSVRLELALAKDATRGRYHYARELARDGEFDAAESILKDLARATDTEDGASAAKHLEYEFYYEKAKWLLVRQRFPESEQVARDLLARDLNRFQRDQVEQVLDYVANVNGAIGMGERAKAEAACRQLIVFLANLYVNDGRYPETLSLADLERLDPYSSRSIVNALASIDEYRAWQDHYSLVVVGKQGHRFEVVDGQIKE